MKKRRRVSSKMCVLRNDFHRTEVRVKDGTMLYGDSLARVRRKLCPSCRGSGCTCGGPVGTRGPQECEVIPLGDGMYSIAKEY